MFRFDTFNRLYSFRNYDYSFTWFNWWSRNFDCALSHRLFEIKNIYIYSKLFSFEDINTDPQWKILGMVVCSIMLLTVLITLCIFIYCYKKGHIMNNKNNREFISNIPYGNMDNRSILGVDDDTIEVHDKLTNTTTTISPLRPRNIRQGVWEGQNAFGGQLIRPAHPPVMVNRVIEALPNDIDRQQGIPVNHQPTIIHIPSVRRRQEPEYEIVEEIIRQPSANDEIVEIIELPTKSRTKPRFTNVSVRHVKNFDENLS